VLWIRTSQQNSMFEQVQFDTGFQYNTP
jgi:hypothetical protein